MSVEFQKIEVALVTSLEGKGIEGDPYRHVKYYFRVDDGSLILRADPCQSCNPKSKKKIKP